MTDNDLNFPVFDDTLLPPPVLDMDQYHAWVMGHWMAMSPTERERAIKQGSADHAGAPFTLDEPRAA